MAGLFDANTYLNSNPDVAAAVKAGQFTSAQQHFDMYGKNENRTFSAPATPAIPKATTATSGGLFNPKTYFDANPDLAKAGLTVNDAADHYAKYGVNENRPGTSANTPMVAPQGQNMTEAQIIAANPFKYDAGAGTFQRTENMSRYYAAPSGFDEKSYLAQNPDVAAVVANGDFVDGLSHFLKYGRDEGRSMGTPQTGADTSAGSGAGAGFSGTVPYTNVGENRRSDSVMDRVMDYTSQDSPIMQQARTQGAKFGNARGLLNSSMAGQAAQEAVINAAVPIASQEASQAMQTNLADANRELELIMQQNQISLADRQQLRQISSTEGLASADRALQNLLSQRQVDYGTSQAALNRSLEADLAKLNLNQSAKQLLLGTSNNLEAIRADKVANINANTNLDAATRATMIATAQKEFEDAWTFAKELASVSVEY